MIDQIPTEIRSPSNSAEFSKLRWRKFPVLDDGFVSLVDVMGDDQAVVQAARVSYGDGTRKVSDDRGLIRYLMRHRHSTPFEMAELKFLVRVPMDTWRQWIRHRTANVNEYSTRYSLAIDSAQKTKPDEWRAQSGSNHQGSAGPLTPETTELGRLWQRAHDSGVSAGHLEPMTLNEHLTAREAQFHKDAVELYQDRVHYGVAREQARKDLPLSTYTEAYWKIDLHNLLHFLSLRMDGHAQQEIRSYATTMGDEIVKPLFPLVWEAFTDYRLEAQCLSRLDKDVIRRLFVTQLTKADFMAAQDPSWVGLERCREREECLAKLIKLGLILDE